MLECASTRCRCVEYELALWLENRKSGKITLVNFQLTNSALGPQFAVAIAGSEMSAFKKLAVVLALGAGCVAAVPSAAAEDPYAWNNRDMKQHFVAGFLIGSIVTADSESPRKGVIVGATIGVLKEVLDDASFHHSTGDALATAVGAIAGSYFTGLIVVPGAVWYRFEW